MGGARFTRRVVAAWCIAVAAALGAAVMWPGAATAAGCAQGRIRTASGCTALVAARREVEAIVHRQVEANGLRGVLARVDVANRTLARVAAGNSMAGVPTNFRMHFRIGSIAIPYVIDVLLQLQDAGRLSLDDPLSKWLPKLPNADHVSLRMLANSTSGYADWVQENPTFLNTLYANVFRQWTTNELLNIALARPALCPPGTCFHYAHTNFIILGKVIHRVTGRPVAQLLRQRVLRPLGLRHTAISALPEIPRPVLHSYTVDRGPYEDSTYWSPSWTIAASMIMTGTIGDVMTSAKAFGRGALISKAAARQRVAPTSAGLPGFSQNLYYALGIVILNTWQIQNPQLNGWTAIQAYLPSRRIAVALAVTRRKPAAATGINYSQQLLEAISAYLTPKHPATFSATG